MSTVGYFLSADLLGFKALVSNLKGAELDRRVSEWTSLVTRLAARNKLTQIQLVSDTVFIGTGNRTQDLEALISFSKNLLEEGLSASLPVRGGIALGEYTWGDMIFGPAVVAAHDLEVNQNWIGISCTNSFPNMTPHWSLDRLVCYSIPKKTGKISLHPTVAWDQPNDLPLAKLLTGQGLTREGEYLEWPWLDKMANTLTFRSYLAIVRSLPNADPGSFYGPATTELIDYFVRNNLNGVSKTFKIEGGKALTLLGTQYRK